MARTKKDPSAEPKPKAERKAREPKVAVTWTIKIENATGEKVRREVVASSAKKAAQIATDDDALSTLGVVDGESKRLTYKAVSLDADGDPSSKPKVFGAIITPETKRTIDIDWE